ncbi:MAG: hypothetical protein GEU93_04180 [Propionibacteriales bacterium]|nr:hypothetical protein [Propionibacteriales bacterium]
MLTGHPPRPSSRNKDIRESRASGSSRSRTRSAHRSLPGLVVTVLWRWRFEIVGVIMLWLTWSMLTDWFGTIAGIINLVLVAGLAVAVTPIRRFITGRLWCMITRHRLRTVLAEVRATTRAGRLPFIMRMARTPVGERAWVWCRAGVCAEDIEQKTAQVRSACFARDARVHRHPRWSHVVTIDVVRRDPLAATEVIGSPLKPAAGRAPVREASSVPALTPSRMGGDAA